MNTKTLLESKPGFTWTRFFLGAGGFMLGSTISTQFKLANLGTDEIINFTPFYFNVMAPLTILDHGGQMRPTETSGIRDKGADEVD